MPSKTHQLIAIGNALRRKRGPCYICGQPINYTLPHDHPMAFTIEHIHPRSTHPHLENDPSNCVPSHAKCNKARGNGAQRPGLGNLSREW